MVMVALEKAIECKVNSFMIAMKDFNHLDVRWYESSAKLVHLFSDLSRWKFTGFNYTVPYDMQTLTQILPWQCKA